MTAARQRTRPASTTTTAWPARPGPCTEARDAERPAGARGKVRRQASTPTGRYGHTEPTSGDEDAERMSCRIGVDVQRLVQVIRAVEEEVSA
jgi:hypothetical protein